MWPKIFSCIASAVTFFMFMTISHAEDIIRELSTDRPDKTESPYTVDKGYFQLEMDFLNFASDKSAALRERQATISPVNIKYGLSDNLDLQFVFDGYIEQSKSELNSGIKEKKYGTGDLSARLKINVWGNHQAGSALALMPFVKAPAASNNLGIDAYEGGLIIPYAFELSDFFGLGLMTELDIVRNEDNDGNHAALINSITVSYDLNETLGVYIEYYAEQHTEENKSFIATVDIGSSVAVSEYSQLDFGLNVGVTDAAEDLNPFIGYSQKFI